MSVGDVMRSAKAPTWKDALSQVSVQQQAFLREAPQESLQPAPDNPPTIWQPLPDGPVITIPKGSTNIPVASVTGFEVGQKIAIGYGATYPVALNPIEKYEVVTVTEVGKPEHRASSRWMQSRRYKHQGASHW